MPPAGLRSRIADQFSYRGETAAVWRAFDRVFATDRYLNLGYSRAYQSHLVGSPQRRLAVVLGRGVAERVAPPGRVLDLGCGRGGPTILLNRRFGFEAVGLDLVPYNVHRAREHARRAAVPVSFVVGEAGRLPFGADSFAACVSIDAPVYFEEKRRVFDGIATVLTPGGVVAVSDLVCDSTDPGRDSAAVAAFADAWDMPPILPRATYLEHLEAAGLTVETVEDVTANSIGRFRTWTRLYLGLAEHTELLDRLFGRWELDGAAITERVRRTHEALPALAHLLVFARR